MGGQDTPEVESGASAVTEDGTVEQQEESGGPSV